ncbi:hypothetical protein VFPPC_16887 [Pochonia chlamydosporia 170]|uniref:Uncharacterized protein n=1 Tax=Pochonia chlamydosporia 170 TaxID=1380566 RepID=A0A179F1I3_METCM|nr:hypothetical protein VFPPC_16887 [Pochonia chlamydosporia 170]OAQ59120.1 hypothetical protein VFPPC_16887 [Pochonia chlamydosporia 170]
MFLPSSQEMPSLETSWSTEVRSVRLLFLELVQMKLSDTTKRVLGDRNINRTDHSVNSTLSSHNAHDSPC